VQPSKSTSGAENVSARRWSSLKLVSSPEKIFTLFAFPFRHSLDGKKENG
jgi:hypothetical protein